MKLKYIFSILCVLLLLSCEKDGYKSTGTITGQDMALCACCGGYFIEMNGTNYRFESSRLPSGFTFSDKELPLTVELDWKSDDSYCPAYNWISVTRIRKK